MPHPVLVVARASELAQWQPALEARGLRVIPAADRGDAKSELARSNVSAVVVSERLPWNGALRLVREVRTDQSLATVPVVVVGLPEVTPSMRLRLRGGAPDATLPRTATPEAVAQRVEEAIAAGPVKPVELTPAQERAARLQRTANILMIFGLILSMPLTGPAGPGQAWWILLVPAGGLLADWATGRVDGRKKLFSWQGWAAIAAAVVLVGVILRFPGFFGPVMRK
jgi:hypothetical protein